MFELGVGISSVFFLKKTDQAYTEILDTAVPLLNEIRKASLETSDLQRFCANLLLAQDPLEKEILFGKVTNAWKTASAKLGEIEHSARMAHSTAVTKCRTAQDDYFREVESFLSLVKAGDRSKAADLRNRSLRPAFEELQRRQSELADLTASRAEGANDAVSARSTVIQRIILAATTGPYVIALAVFFIVALILLCLSRNLDEP